MWWVTARAAAWVFLISGVTAAVFAVRLPPILPPEIPEVVPSVPVGVDYSKPHVDSLVTLVRERNLFRQRRQPSPPALHGDDVLFSDASSATGAASDTRPSIQLQGIVAGSAPSAVILGLPGVEGARVVRPGDVIGSLTIQHIWDDSVRVAGLDTLWILPLRRGGR
jgi:hypothetical protein